VSLVVVWAGLRYSLAVGSRCSLLAHCHHRTAAGGGLPVNVR